MQTPNNDQDNVFAKKVHLNDRVLSGYEKDLMKTADTDLLKRGIDCTVNTLYTGETVVFRNVKSMIVQVLSGEQLAITIKGRILQYAQPIILAPSPPDFNGSPTLYGNHLIIANARHVTIQVADPHLTKLGLSNSAVYSAIVTY